MKGAIAVKYGAAAMLLVIVDGLLFGIAKRVGAYVGDTAALRYTVLEMAFMLAGAAWIAMSMVLEVVKYEHLLAQTPTQKTDEGDGEYDAA